MEIQIYMTDKLDCSTVHRFLFSIVYYEFDVLNSSLHLPWRSPLSLAIVDIYHDSYTYRSRFNSGGIRLAVIFWQVVSLDKSISLIERYCTCTWSMARDFLYHTSSPSQGGFLGQYLEYPELEETDTAQGQGLREFMSGLVLGSLCNGKIGLGLEHDFASMSYFN